VFSNLIDVERIIHSFKTLIACLIGVLLAKLSGLPSGQWIVITICVVMCSQIYVGSVIQKSYLRFLGTLIGCLFAVAAIFITPNIHLAAVGAIAISTFFFTYIATGAESLTYTGTLGAVTTAIIMLGPQNPSLTVASERFFEISVGILIATLVSQFIFPIHARTHLRKAQAKTLSQLRDYYVAVSSGDSGKTTDDYIEVDEKIAKSLQKQRQLAKESAREPLGEAFNSEHFIQTLYCEREMLRAITFMHNALVHIPHVKATYLTASAVLEFNNELVKGLDDLIHAIETDAPQKLPVLIPSFDTIRDRIEKIAPTISRDEQIYIDGLLFSAEILTSRLKKLVSLYRLRAVEETPSSS